MEFIIWVLVLVHSFNLGYTFAEDKQKEPQSQELHK